VESIQNGVVAVAAFIKRLYPNREQGNRQRSVISYASPRRHANLAGQ